MATILLIDDERSVREMLEALLSGEHECHSADRAEQAIQFLEFEDYDLVITDVSMPGLGGLEVLRRINSKHSIPVIVISGRPDEYEDEALKMGAVAFFSKPFPLAELEQAVTAVTSQAVPAEVVQTPPHDILAEH